MREKSSSIFPIVFIISRNSPTIQISHYCLSSQTHSKCLMSIGGSAGTLVPPPPPIPANPCVYILKGLIKTYLKLKEHCFKCTTQSVSLRSWFLSNPPYVCGAQSLTWKVAFTQVCTAAPEDPRMSGVIRGFEDSWLPSWSHSLYLKPDILSLLFGSTVRSPMGIMKIFLFYDLLLQTSISIRFTWHNGS